MKLNPLNGKKFKCVIIGKKSLNAESYTTTMIGTVNEVEGDAHEENVVTELLRLVSEMNEQENGDMKIIESIQLTVPVL